MKTGLLPFFHFIPTGEIVFCFFAPFIPGATFAGQLSPFPSTTSHTFSQDAIQPCPEHPG
jgi:hypothetical protein